MKRVASCQYPLETLANWNEFESKVESYVVQAKEGGAELLLFPEYIGIECATLRSNNDLELFRATHSTHQAFLALFKKLVKAYQIYILAGTTMVEAEKDKFYNRAYFFSPSGAYGHQDKFHLVSSEKEDSLLLSGKEQTLFQTSLGLVGIAICYDSEFPEIVRKLTMAGAQLILVPSYTPSLNGFHRVYFSCHARAIENQCYILASFVVGKVKFGGEIHNMVGQSHAFSPIDLGFPEAGILAKGERDTTGVIFADLEFSKLDRVRKQGQVSNFEDSQGTFTSLDRFCNLE